MVPKIKAVITGSTGMVGEGVLHECLLHPDVESVLVINRKSCNISDPRLKEIIHKDFYDLTSVENQLTGYNACFFCLGISSIGMDEREYYDTTYNLTMYMAKTLLKYNPEMTFCYVSGAGTDSSEKGSIMWAKVKGKIENDLMKLPFRMVYAFRPGFIMPVKGLNNTHRYYHYISWLLPLMRIIAPKFVGRQREIGLAMVNSVLYGYEKQVLEVSDIRKLSKKGN